MNILQSNYGAHEGSIAKFVRTNLGMTLPHDAVGRMVANILVYYLTSHFKMGKITDRLGAFG
jgi:hypothetical protein